MPKHIGLSAALLYQVDDVGLSCRPTLGASRSAKQEIAGAFWQSIALNDISLDRAVRSMRLREGIFLNLRVGSRAIGIAIGRHEDQ